MFMNGYCKVALFEIMNKFCEISFEYLNDNIIVNANAEMPMLRFPNVRHI